MGRCLYEIISIIIVIKTERISYIMPVPNTVSREETKVLETFRKLGRAIGEDEYHMINQTMDFAGRGLGFEYQLTRWHDIDEKFNSRLGAVPYSSRLHNIIEGLVKKRRIRRNPSNPIELEYCGN